MDRAPTLPATGDRSAIVLLSPPMHPGHARWGAAALLLAATLVAVPAVAQDASPTPAATTAAPASAPPAGSAPAAAPAPPPPPGPPLGFERVQYPPATAYTYPPRPRPGPRRNPTLAVSGIVLASVGVVTGIVGGAIFGATLPVGCEFGGGSSGSLDLRADERCQRDDTLLGASIGMMIGGGVAIAAGIPMIVVGARRGPAPPTSGLRVGPGNAVFFGQF